MGLAYKLAAASSQIVATAIEVTEFPDLAARYQVSGVPKTVVNAADAKIRGTRGPDRPQACCGKHADHRLVIFRFAPG